MSNSEHLWFLVQTNVTRDMDNVMFIISADNRISIWTPINSWEPHILYQRASISLNITDAIDSGYQLSSESAFCILIDSSELTKALETIFNKMNGCDTENSVIFSKIAEIARKSPEICLILNPLGDSLSVWGIDVMVLLRSLRLIGEASGLPQW